MIEKDDATVIAVIDQTLSWDEHDERRIGTESATADPDGMHETGGSTWLE